MTNRRNFKQRTLKEMRLKKRRAQMVDSFETPEQSAEKPTRVVVYDRYVR